MFGIFGSFAGAVILGVPVAFALILAGAGYLVATDQHMGTLSSYLYAALNNSSLLSIPFFILAAEILNRCGATQRLVEFVDAWMGHNRGGLPVVAVVTTTFFSAICGSSAATAGATPERTPSTYAATPSSVASSRPGTSVAWNRSAIDVS
ncbi:MAG: TRAP transporter large permease subunit, partial [Comamonadaceae bacterium]